MKFDAAIKQIYMNAEPGRSLKDIAGDVSYTACGEIGGRYTKQKAISLVNAVNFALDESGVFFVDADGNNLRFTIAEVAGKNECEVRIAGRAVASSNGRTRFTAREAVSMIYQVINRTANRGGVFDPAHVYLFV